ncbi:MAG: 50S ribosomal protein L24 [Methylococcales bacterium]
MKKIRKGDDVIVISGRDKGKRGSVSKLLGQRAVVSGVNINKKHQKPNPNKGVEGGIVEKEAAIHISNIAIFNAQTGKADRVGLKTLDDERKVRFYKSTGEVVDL